MEENPEITKEDRPQRKDWILVPRENWYRDVITFIIAGILFWSAIVGQETAGQSQRTANEAASLARVNSQLVVFIQKQRYDSIFNACWDQNVRHDKTIAQLQVQTKYYEKHPIFAISKAQLRASTSRTIVLINTLAPRQDCSKLASKSTR